MANGYTHPVINGEVETLYDFAMLCARAFMPFVLQRDEDVSVPPRVSAGEIERARDRLDEALNAYETIESLSSEDIERLGREALEKGRAHINEFNEESRLSVERCRALQKKVSEWWPKDEGVKKLRQFMLDQLKDTIAFESREMPVPDYTPEEWYERELETAARTIKYRAEDLERETERVKVQKQWLKELEQLR